MAHMLGLTLHKFVMDYGVEDLLHDRSDLDIFMQSLVKLEALELRIYPTYGYPPDYSGMRLPTTLPWLWYLYINQMAVPFLAIASPTHVHFSLNEFISSVLHPTITHLSIVALDDGTFDELASLASSTPNMVSLTLSGSYKSITHILVSYLLPPIMHLRISQLLYYSGYEVLEHINGLQALVNAIGKLRARCNNNLVNVKFEMNTVVRDLRKWVSKGRVDMNLLIGCGFTVEDWDGQALLDVVARTNEIDSETDSETDAGTDAGTGLEAGSETGSDNDYSSAFLAYVPTRCTYSFSS
ncbi:hypothetical protein OF83DRAFT_1175128 [Amylostereum chailletii]|nr:hypothetical protein OF83DRAFT_1175128 [Amylostereum chailletii]